MPDAGEAVHFKRFPSIATYLLLLLLLVTTAAVYVPALPAPFIYDDQSTIDVNDSIRQLWPLSIPLSPPVNLTMSGRPLVNLTFAINYAIGGEDPRGYHAVNVGLHLGCVVLLYFVVRHCLSHGRLERFRDVASPLGLLTAGLWALHPLNTEAVAYVTQRTELMVTLFYLATLACAQHYWFRGGRAWLLGAALCCAAGAASKEVIATAPVVMLLYERTFVRRSLPQALRASWPLYASLIPAGVLLAYLNMDAPRGNTAGFGLGVSGPVWWMTQSKILMMYLKLVIWPQPLLIHYAVPYQTNLFMALPWVLPVLFLIWATIIAAWKRHPLGFVAAAMLLVLAPTFLIPIITEVVAERRMYLPLAGIMSAAVVVAYVMAQRLRTVAAVAIVLCLAWGTATAWRAAAYRDPIGLWRQVIAHQDPRVTGKLAATSYDNLGSLLDKAGRSEEAVVEFTRALKLNPDFPSTWLNLGVALWRSGQIDQSAKIYTTMLQKWPNYRPAYANLGAMLLKEGRNAEAEQPLRKAIALDENNVNPRQDLVILLRRMGRIDETVEQYERLIKLKPNDAGYRFELAMTLEQMGQVHRAAEQYRQVLKLAPNAPISLNNLAWLLATHPGLRNPQEAVRLAQRAVDLTGGQNVNMLDTLATAQAAVGDHAAALATARRGLELANALGNEKLAAKFQAVIDHREDQDLKDGDR